MAARPPKDFKTIKECKKAIREAEESKRGWQENIEHWEKRIAGYQSQLQDPSITQERREMLEGNMKDWEGRIQFRKAAIADDEKTASRAAAALQTTVHAILSDVGFRDKFTSGTTEKCFNSDTLSGTMSGYAGSGKSHTLAILTDTKPPSLRASTAISKTPVRTITHATICAKGKRSFKAISDNDYTDKFLVTSREGVTVQSPPSFLRMLFYRPPMPTHQVEKDLIVKFSTLGDDVESFENQVVVDIADCGGQPQFLEVLPRFLENLDFGIVVTDLSQSFDDYPINYYYSEEGTSVGEGVPSSLTNEQVIRMCLRMIASQSQGDRPVKFAIVGTHRDLEGTCIHPGKDSESKHKKGRCSQPREEKNRRLKEMLESFNLLNNVIYRNRHKQEFIFAINAKSPEPLDYETVGELKECIMTECTPRTISIPLSYHAVELTLKKKAKESGHIAFAKSDILKEVPNCNFTEESFKDALRYLHKRKRIFYYEKEFPGRVIGEPQAVLNKHTEIVVYHIRLSTNPQEMERLTTKMWRFVQYGILTIHLLEKFPNHYVEGVFSPADMMKLFERLLIVSEVSDGEYLMPSVLKTVQQPDCNPEPGTQSLPPMVLHFQGGPVRYGVFCGTICHLMTRSKWKLLMDPETANQPFHITRNSVHFQLSDCQGKVTINDPLDSFFVVTIHVFTRTSGPAYSEPMALLCTKIRDTLLEAIAEVTEKLNYSPDIPEVAFLCRAKHNPRTSLHPAKASRFGELLCTQDNTIAGSLTAPHRVWLRVSPPRQPDSVPLASTMPSSNVEPALSTQQLDESFVIIDLPTRHGQPDPISPQPTEATPPSSTDKPLFHQLKFLKFRGQKVKIVESVAVKWKELAYALTFADNVVQIIREDKKHDSCEEACEEMFRRWLGGAVTHQEVTWGRLIEALRDADHGVLAEEVEQLLRKL